MTKIPIPRGSWMRLRQRGRYVYAINKTPITWTNLPPAKGTAVYHVAWTAGQGPLMAKRVVIEKE